jgi:predicted nucleic acid-binding protein
MDDLTYIDASAFVKLFSEEPESVRMASLIDEGRSYLVANEILAIEAFRTAARLGEDAPAKASALLRSVALRPLSREIRDLACRIGTPSLRTLDAIHLATAASLGEKVGAILTYDKRLAEASAAVGLQVLAPA